MSIFSPRLARNVAIKGLVLWILFNLLFAAGYSPHLLGKISAYNHLFPGRLRLPYGDNPERSYNLSLYNLDAMFASHEIAGEVKQPGEYRVLILGDSSTWGFLLAPQDTLAAQINRFAYRLDDGRTVRAYNLGYPVMSLTKDLLILKRAMAYQPDLIAWAFTLESFPYDKQLFPPLLQQNLQEVAQLASQNHLSIEIPPVARPSLWNRSLFARRRDLADLFRLQLFGVMWAATGIDQEIPSQFTPRQEDLSASLDFHNLLPPHLGANDLALEVISAGVEMAGSVPVVLVNEPVFISQGLNSDVRYNFYYPRWAYDDYRQILSEQAALHSWDYHDAWDLVPASEFTNTAIHLTPEGTRQFASRVGQAILAAARAQP